MPILTPAQLQSLSDLAVNLAFDKVADIKREMLTPNTSGGATLAYSTVASGVSCCVVADTAKPIERPIAGQQATEVIKKVYFPRGTDVRDSDRLTIDGRNYHITGVSTGVSFEVLTMATVREEFGL